MDELFECLLCGSLVEEFWPELFHRFWEDPMPIRLCPSCGESVARFPEGHGLCGFYDRFCDRWSYQK